MWFLTCHMAPPGAKDDLETVKSFPPYLGGVLVSLDSLSSMCAWVPRCGSRSWGTSLGLHWSLVSCSWLCWLQLALCVRQGPDVLDPAHPWLFEFCSWIQNGLGVHVVYQDTLSYDSAEWVPVFAQEGHGPGDLGVSIMCFHRQDVGSFLSSFAWCSRLLLSMLRPDSPT